MGVFQSKIQEGVAMPSSRVSSQHTDWTQVSPPPHCGHSPYCTISQSLLKIMSLVCDAIWPSHPPPPPSPLSLSLSQRQGLFHWVSSSHQVARILEIQLQHQSFQWIFMVYFLYDWLAWSPFNIIFKSYSDGQNYSSNQMVFYSNSLRNTS